MELIFKCNQEKTEATCCGITDMDYSGDVIIPETYDGMSVVAIGFEAFSKSKITSVRIPRTVTSIRMKAFAYCDNLQHISFDEGSCLEIIEPIAFSGCRKLTYIRLPDKLHVIEHLAFNHCANCTIEIPNRVLVMYPCFEECNKVTSYEPNLPPLAPIEKDEHGNKFRLNQNRDGYIVEKIRATDTTINVPEMFNGLPVVELGDMPFSQNTEARKAIIPSSVTKAGYFPFYACDEMGYANYGGTTAQWKKMNVYTWFNVYCEDGIVEGHG
jgi:hypothetical protein